MVRYIGKSSSGLARARRHRYYSSPGDEVTHCRRWVRELQNIGLNYVIVVLEHSTSEALSECECWWIAYARACGWPLTNLTDGGEGTPGKKISASTRQRLSETAKIRANLPENRKLYSDRQKASWQTQARREKVSGERSHTKRPDVRARISVAAKLRCNTPQNKQAAASRWRLNNPMHRPEVRAKRKATLEAKRREPK